MEIIIQPDAESASLRAAQCVARLIRAKPDAVLGLATGGTPLRLYQELVRLHRSEGLDCRRVRTFNLDEYYGLAPTHPASYYSFMHQHVFDPLHIPPENVHLLDGQTTDVPGHCTAYEKSIRNLGGIDLQILGVGSDGHIGFNEPMSSLASRTRIKTLTPQTRADNARFFDSPAAVPHHVLTMGIGMILESRECLLLAFGEAKAEMIAAMVEGPLTAMVPASALQLHPVVRVFIDKAAASRLQKTDYYRWVYEHKPAWQR